VKQVGFPIKMSRTPASVRRPAPALGEHDVEALETTPPLAHRGPKGR
jgi:crotonobetainyl-CoA:carnitine CoA-transferase CaiB-like acyl-CoA transferase